MSAIGNIFTQINVRKELGLLSFMKGLFLASLWQIYKRVIGLPLMIKTYKGTNFLLRPNCVISSRFVYEGRPDKYYVKILAAFADKETCFVDVGANVGLYSVLLCNDFSKGWLFEPNPVAARMARHNIAINDVGDRFQIVEAAAGSNNGIAKFPVLDIPLTTARVGEKQTGKMMEVRLLRLDCFLPRNKGSYVVKVDAEGADAEVLNGLRSLFSSGKVKICQFECQTNDILFRIHDFANGLNYAIMDRRRRLDPSSKFYNKISRDFFLVRSDLVDHYLCLQETNIS